MLLSAMMRSVFKVLRARFAQEVGCQRLDVDVVSFLFLADELLPIAFVFVTSVGIGGGMGCKRLF